MDERKKEQARACKVIRGKQFLICDEKKEQARECVCEKEFELNYLDNIIPQMPSRNQKHLHIRVQICISKPARSQNRTILNRLTKPVTDTHPFEKWVFILEILPGVPASKLTSVLKNPIFYMGLWYVYTGNSDFPPPA